jgi:Tol biopolymer transport system component/DNA-binding winged helix-turn-helix (wHTH) protein
MTYRFGDIEIDTEAFRVVRAGEAVHLEPKAVELLMFLARNPGRLVTKAELQEAVWKDTAVTDNALTRLVAQIRKGLGDDAREARFIATVPTRGYRFVAQPGTVEGPDHVTAPLRPEPRAPRWRPGIRAATVAAGLALTLAALSYALWRRNAPAIAPSTATVAPRARELQASTSDGLNVFPRFSPDGSTLAYATLRNGSMEIVLRGLAPGAREVPLTADGQQNVQPAFAPDGRLLAYHSVGRGGIWVIPALGGAPRRLTRFGSMPVFSPDGSQLVFQRQSWTGSSESSFAAGEGSTLWLAPLAGGDPRPLTAVEQTGPGGHGSATWSPSGHLIAFVAAGRIFTIRPDGSGLRRTIEGPWINEVAWGPGGDTQIWTGWRQFNWHVWRVRVDPETGVPKGEPEVLASGGEPAAAWRQPVISADGRRLAYVRYRTRHELLAQRLTSTGAPDGEPTPIVRGLAGRKQPPLFSPDGRRLAFGVFRPGEGLALWVADAEGREPRLVVERPDIWAVSRWFPDSRHVGLAMREDEGQAFWSVDVDTGELSRVRALEPQMQIPVLSPDGTRLAAHGSKDGVLNVWVAPTREGEAHPVTNDREGIGWPVWSPDGKTLAVEIFRGGDTRLAVMPSSGGPFRELTTAAGHSWPFSFSPDGRRIAFAGQRGGIWNVYWVSVDGGEERRLTSYTLPALFVRYCEWSPRGDRIAYEYAETASTVWVRELPPVRHD